MYRAAPITLSRLERIDLCRANYRAMLNVMTYGDVMKIKPYDLRFKNMMQYNQFTKLFCRVYELPTVSKACVHVPHAWTMNTLRQNLTKVCTVPEFKRRAGGLGYIHPPMKA